MGTVCVFACIIKIIIILTQNDERSRLYCEFGFRLLSRGAKSKQIKWFTLKHDRNMHKQDVVILDISVSLSWFLPLYFVFFTYYVFLQTPSLAKLHWQRAKIQKHRCLWLYSVCSFILFISFINLVLDMPSPTVQAIVNQYLISLESPKTIVMLYRSGTKTTKAAYTYMLISQLLIPPTFWYVMEMRLWVNY